MRRPRPAAPTRADARPSPRARATRARARSHTHTFSRLSCRALSTTRRARAPRAAQIIKARPPYTQQAKREIEILRHLHKRDPRCQYGTVQLLGHFVHHGHQCMVFELLSMNLYKLLEKVQFHGFSLALIRKFAWQLLKTLAFLSHDAIGIVHCDLKPENICLRQPEYNTIKLIDFGSSCERDKRLYSYIQSRYYRSPEVMLGVPYGCQVDMWRLGCVRRLHTASRSSRASTSGTALRVIAMVGRPPDALVDRAPRDVRRRFFEAADDGDGRPSRPPPGSGAAAAAAAATDPPHSPDAPPPPEPSAAAAAARGRAPPRPRAGACAPSTCRRSRR